MCQPVFDILGSERLWPTRKWTLCVHIMIAPQTLTVLDSLIQTGLNAPLPRDSLFWASSQKVLAQRDPPAHKMGHVVVVAVQAT